MVAHPASSAGAVRAAAYCGQAVVQWDSTNAIAFVHTNADAKGYIQDAQRPWDERARRLPVLRVVDTEGSGAVSAQEDALCGGKSAIKVDHAYSELNLTRQLGFDMERRRHDLLAHWLRHARAATDT